MTLDYTPKTEHDHLEEGGFIAGYFRQTLVL